MATFESASLVAVVLTVFSCLFVLVRLLARIAFVKHVGVDDCLIVLAAAAAIALAVVIRRGMLEARSRDLVMADSL
jgi:hypothetical protein